MKLNYRKLVPLICPDRGSGFGIVRAVIMATTESSLYNMAFVETRRRDACKPELDVTASHTATQPHSPKAQEGKPAMLMAASSS